VRHREQKESQFKRPAEISPAFWFFGSSGIFVVEKSCIASDFFVLVLDGWLNCGDTDG
jgi:hypothetical protein